MSCMAPWLVSGVLQWMQRSKPWQAGNALVDSGVELHRARSEWVDRDIDRVVLLTHAGEVAHDIDFADLWPGEVLALEFDGGWDILERWRRER